MDFDINTQSSSSSSPDPLGQPDLSSPLRTPRDRTRSRSRRRASRTQEILRTPTPAPRPASRASSRRRTPASVGLNGLSAQRKDTQIRAARQSPEEVAPDEEEGEEGVEEDTPLDMAADGPPSSPGSPNQSFLGDATITTVPLKTGDETPKRGRRKRPGTPRRKGIPIARRSEDRIFDITRSSDEEDAAVPAPSPTPKRGSGRPRKSPKITSDNLFGPPLNAHLKLSAPEPTIPLPGASPGKRRRVVSDSRDDFTYTIRNPGSSNFQQLNSTSSAVKSATKQSPNREQASQFTNESVSLSSANPIAATAKIYDPQPRSLFPDTFDGPDPTDIHDEFDSILESEDFTRVSLSTIPSGRQLLRTLGAPDTSTAEDGTGPSNTTSRGKSVSPMPNTDATIEHGAETSAVNESSMAGSGLLGGFGPGTKRGMREALRLGDRLAKQQVEAKKAAAAVEEATANIWDELADEESSIASTSIDPLSSNMQAFARNNSVAAFPDSNPVGAGVDYPELPRQQPTPDQSDDHEQGAPGGNEMSWRYDTPAKAALKLPQTQNLDIVQPPPSTAKTPPVPPWSSSPPLSGPHGHLSRSAGIPSSPDKQLFLEQAAYEQETAGSENNAFQPATADHSEDEDDEDEHEEMYRDDDGGCHGDDKTNDKDGIRSNIDINSSDVKSDLSDDSDSSEEPPKMSDATKSILGDEETDIWAEEAQASMEQSGLEQRITGGHAPEVSTQQDEPASSPSQIQSPLLMRGALPEPIVENKPLTKDIRMLEEELYPPRRGKLLSLWRQTDERPVLYSDEPELPPSEDVSELEAKAPDILSKKRKLFTPPEARKQAKFDDADFSVLSEFKNVAPVRKSSSRDSAPPSSPTKQVRFASEDPDHPYYPTTPVHPTVESVLEDADEAEASEEENVADDQSPLEAERTAKRQKRDSPESITWEEKTPPKQGPWLSGWLPSWFKVPREPIFNFSFPRFVAKTEEPKPEQYNPTMPDGTFTVDDHHALVRLYDSAKFNTLPEAESDDVKALLGKEVQSYGWRKRINAWELAIIEEFLQDEYNDERFTPVDIAIRLFSIWVTDVQEGRTGLGNGTPGIFSSCFVANRTAVLAKARRIRSLAAS